MDNFDSPIGTFVRKATPRAGILPAGLFFIGTGKTFL
jgi:hypothetical protein